MFIFDGKIATVRPYLLLGSAQHEHDYALLRQAGVTHILQVGSELRPSFPDRFEYLRISIDDLEQEDIVRHFRRCFNFINAARQRDDGGLCGPLAPAGSASAHPSRLYARHGSPVVIRAADACDPGDAPQHHHHHHKHHHHHRATPKSQPVAAQGSKSGGEFGGESGAGDGGDVETGAGGGWITAAAAAAVTASPAQKETVVFVHCMAGMSRSASVVLSYLMYDERLPYVEAFKQVKAARPCIYPNLGFLLQLWEWEAGGCDPDTWSGWSKARFVDRLAEYRRAQGEAGLHPAVRVRLPMTPPGKTTAAAAAAAATGAAGGTGAAANPAAAAVSTGAAASCQVRGSYGVVAASGNGGEVINIDANSSSCGGGGGGGARGGCSDLTAINAGSGGCSGGNCGAARHAHGCPPIEGGAGGGGPAATEATAAPSTGGDGGAVGVVAAPAIAAAASTTAMTGGEPCQAAAAAVALPKVPAADAGGGAGSGSLTTSAAAAAAVGLVAGAPPMGHGAGVGVGLEAVRC